MSSWLTVLAHALGFHKPEAGPLYRSDPRLRLGQGGTLVSSLKESVWGGKRAPSSRTPAVVGLAAPPYGLPSTDPTTPATAVQLRCTPVPPPLRDSSSRWWSAHADNSARSEFPLDPLPSRWDRPVYGPYCRRTEDSIDSPRFLACTTLSAAQGLVP
jgi:hypothetical protein